MHKVANVTHNKTREMELFCAQFITTKWRLKGETGIFLTLAIDRHAMAPLTQPHIEQKAGYCPRTVLTMWRTENSLHCGSPLFSPCPDHYAKLPWHIQLTTSLAKKYDHDQRKPEVTLASATFSGPPSSSISWSSVLGGSCSPSSSIRWSSSSFMLHALSIASRGGGGAALSVLPWLPLPLRFPLWDVLRARRELILSCVDWPFFDDLCFFPFFLRLSHGSEDMNIQAKCKIPVCLYWPIQKQPFLSANYSRPEKSGYIISSYTQNYTENIMTIFQRAVHSQILP
jgi:hypothetical protein